MILSCDIGAVHLVHLPDPDVDEPLAPAEKEESIVLAGGCFWGVQAVFQHVAGVYQATSGYAGGSATTAEYGAVSGGATGHAECVKVTFDASKITLGRILKIFFSVAHDPTEVDHQGPDAGTQYRSAIFTDVEDQKKIIEAYIAQLNKASVFPRPLATRVEPLEAFYKAEDYHQDYARIHPNDAYIAANDLPKVLALKKEFPDLYVASPSFFG